MSNHPNVHSNPSFFQPTYPFQTQQMQSPNVQMNPIRKFTKILIPETIKTSTHLHFLEYHPQQAECPFPQQVMPLNFPSHSDILPEELCKINFNLSA